MNNIIKTLAYFDIFNTPLTREEIYYWLWEEKITDYSSLDVQLNELEKQKIIAKKYGYYFLPGKENLTETREKTIPIVEKKMQIAVRAAKKIRWVPFAEAMFICNTVAGGGVKKNSDIDVFIVIKTGRLWLARLLTVLILSVFGLRRDQTKIANKICLSFYITDNALNLSAIKISDPDIYLTYWIDNLIPIYDPKNFKNKIRNENQWVKKYLPNALTSYHPLPRRQVENSKFSKYFKMFFEKSWGGAYGDLLEKQAKKIQKIKMKINLFNTRRKNNLGVIINDTMLKFHENDRRELYQKQWQEKYESFNKNS